MLSRENVDQEALLSYAREAADFSTQQQLPSLDFAINHYGQPDVAMFDFTCMYASENAALVREHNGHQLLVALVGDSLLEVRAGVRGGMTRNMGSQAGSVCVILPCRVQPRGSEPAELGLGPARLLGGRAVCPATTSSQGQRLSLLRSLVSLY